MRYALMFATTVALLSLITPAFVAASPISKTVEAVNIEKAQLSGKQVTLRGKVVKVNNGIMKRNFIHIVDGTGEGDNGKVIITSTQTAQVGDEIITTGTVGLDIDFTMGYKYDILIEKATIKPAM